MSLTAALRTAQSALQNTAAQTSVTTRNVAGSGDPSYSRKIALASSTADGGAQVLTITRAADKALLESLTDTASRAAAQQALADGLNELNATIGDPELDQSPAALIGAFTDSIQLYSVSPGDQILAQAVITKAGGLANALNDAARTVQRVRQDADAAMDAGVRDLNGLLADFETANKAVVNGTRAGLDITDSLDARDRLMSRISELIGINVVPRADNDAVLYTDSGVTLFETSPRLVSFQATGTFTAGFSGNAITVDGVPVTGAAATMPIRSGRLQGLADLRDNAAVTYSRQLDEIARGLIAAFAESDQSDPPGLPDLPGLFTAGVSAMPGNALVPGLAGAIRVNPTVDPDQGGNLALLRDGGIGAPGNPAYRYNPSGAAGYADRLNDYLGALSAQRSFDAAADVDASNSLPGFAASSVSWLGVVRQNATNAADYEQTLLQRTSEALSNATGVNLDNEMSLLLDLERSYQASSKLIGAIDAMFAMFLAEVA